MNEKAGRAEEQPEYQAYLLRLWQVNEGQEGWRASLESARTGERRGFPSLGALFDYVQAQTRLASNAPSWGRGEEVDELRERR